MDEYINKKEVIELINNWWHTTVYVTSTPTVIEDIEGLQVVHLDDIYCPSCGENLVNMGDK